MGFNSTKQKAVTRSIEANQYSISKIHSILCIINGFQVVTDRETVKSWKCTNYRIANAFVFGGDCLIRERKDENAIYEADRLWLRWRKSGSKLHATYIVTRRNIGGGIDAMSRMNQSNNH